MAQVINTNILSLNAQRNLSNSSGDLQTSLQRLSSGLRINSAKDDAAGLAISERFTTQIRGLNQAVRNSNDGISLAQTAEGALAEVTNNLQRIRELAVQSANATNSASDRAALDAEVQQRIAEINRIAEHTSFNNLFLLDGSFSAQQFQVGANAGQTIQVDFDINVTSTELGLAEGTMEVTQASVTGDPVTSDALAVDSLTINGDAVGVSTAGSGGAAAGEAAGSAFAKLAAINAANIEGVEASAETVVTGEFETVEGAANNNTYTLTINGEDVYDAHVLTAGNELTGEDVADAINANAALQALGISAEWDDVEGELTLTAEGGRDIIVAETIGGDLTGAGVDATLTGTTSGSITLTSEEEIVIDGDNPEFAGFTAETVAVTTEEVEVSGTNVTTVAAANAAMTTIDAALDAVNGYRAELGAIQNRFESVIASLSNVAENLTASRSRILDTDFAAETASLVRAQILQQAGIAILAQANAQPQNVLALLR